MAPLLLILITLGLLVGFFVLTAYEERQGIRYFALKRARLDHAIAHIQFIVTHVDLGAFVRDEIRRFVALLGHAIVHISLQGVRAVERLLTRIIRYLRLRHQETDAPPRRNVREFVKTLSDFKGKLNVTHPELSDVE